MASYLVQYVGTKTWITNYFVPLIHEAIGSVSARTKNSDCLHEKGFDLIRLALTIEHVTQTAPD